ncbi:MAG TPA: carboxypeptidase-like regulatory domain-containing protein [Solirubrobacterales bacterium]|nr:carboxypeptidase-like regulatory domain-containing protein [Solirubrobacterales bacterium]
MTRTLPLHLPARAWLPIACLAAVVAGWSLQPGMAQAGGFYRVAECAPGHPDTPDASVQGTSPAYSAGSSCTSGNWLQVQSGAAAAPGASKQWSYTAPPGTRIEQFEAAYNLVGDPSPDGNRSYLFVRRDGQTQQENLSVVGLGSTTGTYDSSLQDQGPFAAVGVGVLCSKSSDACGYAPGQFARLSRMSFVVEDRTPPGTPIVAGSAADGEWVGGVTEVAVGETDTGSGVHHTTVDAGGVEVDSDTVCDPGLDGAGYVGSMTPCDPIELRYLSVDTTAPGFGEGANPVRFCTHEFGLGGASTCTTKAFRVDNVAPEEPQDLDVAGGQGWHRDNDFDLSWTNPPQADAPIAAATVRVTGPGGYESTVTESGDGISAIDDVTVPAVGTYQAHVFLRDAAGNESPLASAAVDLKFDDTVPVKSQPEISNGWISRPELAGGYLQTWKKPAALEIPPSGIAGYRVAVNTDPDHDPCSGPGDSRACGEELTDVGLDSNSRMLDADDLVEGRNWVHVVPVSGSGMRAAEVGRVPLDVDLTDPTTTLTGAPAGWVDHPLDLDARAEDALSGMVDTDEFPDDAPPRTVLEVDGVAVSEDDADVGARIDTEGIHEIRYWARDLAGNENDRAGANPAPGTAQARIDLTAPSLAFAEGRDPADPDRLEATVGDPLSGVAGGRISFRQAGSSGWTELATDLRGDRLIARMDSARMKPGVTYEFRAEATDRAGNTIVTDRRGDGARMIQTGPFKAVTALRDVAIDGRRSARLAYGARPVASGRLLDASGVPVAGARVELTANYAPGSRRDSRTTVTTTDAGGRFSSRLLKGPSRTVVARYRGDARRLGSTSAPVSARVRGGIRFRAPGRVRAGGRAAFIGRVKARGADFAKRGKSVEVQVRIGRRWKTVGRSIHTDARGRFRLRYRFVASYTRPVRYRFRAVVLRERGWPYLPVKSRQRRLTVVP